MKEVYSVATTWKMVETCLKDYLPFLLKLVILIGMGGEGFYFYPIILLSFDVFRPSYAILANGGRLLELPDCLPYQGQ